MKETDILIQHILEIIQQKLGSEYNIATGPAILIIHTKYKPTFELGSILISDNIHCITTGWGGPKISILEYTNPEFELNFDEFIFNMLKSEKEHELRVRLEKSAAEEILREEDEKIIKYFSLSRA